jgi:hypothetical protein
MVILDLEIEQDEVSGALRSAPFFFRGNALGDERGMTDLAEIRRQITDLVGNGAAGVVETTSEEVGKATTWG